MRGEAGLKGELQTTPRPARESGRGSCEMGSGRAAKGRWPARVSAAARGCAHLAAGIRNRSGHRACAKPAQRRCADRAPTAMSRPKRTLRIALMVPFFEAAVWEQRSTARQTSRAGKALVPPGQSIGRAMLDPSGLTPWAAVRRAGLNPRIRSRVRGQEPSRFLGTKRWKKPDNDINCWGMAMQFQPPGGHHFPWRNSDVAGPQQS